MASIINYNSFKNFYNFYGDYSDNRYDFKEGLNIINADNGMGKSKMFNGFLWILQDMVYDSDTRRKETVANAYPQTELQRCIVHQVRNTLKYVGEKKQEGICK